MSNNQRTFWVEQNPETCPACGLLMGDEEQHKLFHSSLKELRDVTNQQTVLIKQISTALAEFAPVIYELAEKVIGPAPADTAQEIERALASIKEKS